jgi:hypothetical protein
MPIRKLSFDKIKKYFFKPSSEKNYNIKLEKMATSETPGYKWLLFFKSECYSEIASLIGAGPTVKDVVDLFWCNRHHNPLTDKIIKITRMDEIRCFDIEIEDENDNNWGDENNNYNNIELKNQEKLRFIGEHYRNYRFI